MDLTNFSLVIISIIISGAVVSCCGSSTESADILPFQKNGQSVYSDDPYTDGLIFNTRGGDLSGVKRGQAK